MCHCLKKYLTVDTVFRVLVNGIKATSSFATDTLELISLRRPRVGIDPVEQ